MNRRATVLIVDDDPQAIEVLAEALGSDYEIRFAMTGAQTLQMLEQNANAELPTLIAKKTVTLPKLMALAPSGTVDPSSTLYSSTMLAMAGLLVIAFVANWLVRPVNPKHHWQGP